ncbi:MAG: zinc ribbon domain-containing protein [Oscillospiraceae bacterium]|nr:zinc ribbon domain-containing protein [Oscillospiraceae bacterium]
MKRCPKCGGMELYDDTRFTCPYCGETLVSYERRRAGHSGGGLGGPSAAPDRQTEEEPSQEPRFEEKHAGRYSYRGRVVSLAPSERPARPFAKWLAAVFLGQPYQLGDTVHETCIRIEEFSRARLSEQMRNLIYYGQLNDLNVGDDITAAAVLRRGRLIVRELTVHDVESDVRARGQIPPAAVRLLTLLAAAFAVLLAALLVRAFRSGAVFTLLAAAAALLLRLVYKLLVLLAPLLMLLLVYWLILGKR